MAIKFKFQFDKAVGAMAYLLSRLGVVPKAKLVKLLYIADRTHFLKYGYPITGSRQVAMDKGPLPSECLELLDGESTDDIFRHLSLNDNCVKLINNSAAGALSDTEKEVLEYVVNSFGKTPKWELVEYTHKFPEYVEAYQPETSRTISYESMAKHHRPEEFWNGIPILPHTALERMHFAVKAKSDADL